MWKQCFWLTILSMVCLCTFAFSSDYSYQIMEKRRIQKCTSNLANFLHALCNGTYNSMLKYDKKSEPDSMMNREDYWLRPTSEEEYNVPFRTLSEEMMVPVSYRRLKRGPGIVDECCKQSCTLDTMRSYCGR
uniref:Insulin-like domain-containing protein n=3 Tax=Timema TaxID=61471 RepID=A0A7R9G679_TIMSH|nr:unnamed protein product [Timema shepardi]CAD7413499.1 unnamed protein product [Timema poppensis]CAD7575790.1 unnamed protein product [Timema californicum]